MQSVAKSRRGLIVNFNPLTKVFHVTHERILRPIRAMIRRDFAQAVSCMVFPNARGNYAGKRTEIVPAPPLTPDERFARLTAHYGSCRQRYLNPPGRGERRASCA